MDHLPYFRHDNTLVRGQSHLDIHPIDRLPEELLVSIFIEYVGMHWHDSERMPVHYPELYDWIRVSHVNSFWRDVALRWPGLWSRIILPWNNVHLLHELLSRSKNSLLHVRVWGYISEVRGSGFDLIKQHFHRLATLDFRPSGGLDVYSGWRNFITEGLVNAALLTRCSLKIPSKTSMGRNLRLKLAPEFRHISHLEMQGLPFSIIKGFCQPSLASLSITCGMEDISVPVLLSVLSTLSSLEDLSVYPPERPSFPMTDPSVTQCQDVQLPHLSMLKLSSDLVGFSTLLEHLVLPSTTHYVIDLEGDDMHRVISALRRKLQGIKTIGVRSPFTCGQLSAPTVINDAIVWRAWVTDISLEEENPPEETPLLCIRLHTAFHNSNFDPDVVSLFSDLGLSELKALKVVQAWRSIPCGSWANLFALTPHVQELFLTGSSAALSRAISVMGPNPFQAGLQTNLLPYLRSLSIGFGARRVRIGVFRRLLTELVSMLEFRKCKDRLS